MKRLFVPQAWLCLCLFCCFFNNLNARQHVLSIRNDGFHTDMCHDSSWPTPTLRGLMKKDVYTDQVLSVLHSSTYPYHTAMIICALPPKSGTCYNQPWGSHGEWYWDSKATMLPTSWQVLNEYSLATAAIEMAGHL